MHCRKGAQHACPWLYIAVAVVTLPRPLTPQSIMPSLNHCDLPRHAGVNNVPKVVTRQRRGRELNSQRSSCKCNALITGLPSHQCRLLPPQNLAVRRHVRYNIAIYRKFRYLIQRFDFSISKRYIDISICRSITIYSATDSDL